MPPWHCMMQQLAGEADVGEPALDAVQVGAGDRADVGVDHGRRRSARTRRPPWRSSLRDRDEDAGGALGDDLARAALVGGVADRPEEGDRDRVDPGRRAARRPPRATCVLVELDDDVAVGVDPLGDPAGALDRDQRLGLAGLGEAQQVLGRLAGRRGRAPRMVRIVSSKPRGRDQADLGALALDHDVGRDGRAVGDQPVHARVEVGRGQPELLAGRLDRAEEARLEGVGRRGERLAVGDAAVLADQHAVGEGPADVDAAHQSGHSSLLLGRREATLAPDRPPANPLFLRALYGSSKPVSH